MQTTQNKHAFSLYWSELSEQLRQVNNNTVVCNDPQLVHRITNVLRAQKGDQFILFDYAIHVYVALRELHKKKIVLHIISHAANTTIQPSITMFLPLLKRDALEQALYSLVEVGVNAVQLILTEKVQRTFHQQKEYERLEKIISAAAEQSKQYTGLALHKPLMLEHAVRTIAPQAIKLYADPTGESVAHVYAQLKNKPLSELILLIGPEGDLTTSEKKLLHEQQFMFCALTPTVLRSVQAAGLFAGIWRSLLR